MWRHVFLCWAVFCCWGCVGSGAVEGPSVVEAEPRMIPQSFPGRCRRAPPGVAIPKVPGDNGFYIKISGNPDKYVPGELYTGEFYFFSSLFVYENY